MSVRTCRAMERMIFIGVREDIAREPSHPSGWSVPIPMREVVSDFAGRVVAWRNKGGLHDYRSPDEVAPTLDKGGGHTVLNGERSPWPLRVARLLGGYPRAFAFVGSERDGIARIGNAVPPLLMRSIARHVRTLIA